MENEKNIINLSSYRKPEIFRSDSNSVEKLAKLQHYGLPTRLLDITRNPLVALYFATAKSSLNTKNKDGALYIFRDEINDLYDLSELEKLGENGNWCKNDSLAESFKSKTHIFLEAPSTLERQNAQQGMYILFLNDIKKDDKGYRFEDNISPMSTTDQSIVGKIVISGRGKRVIREELEALGISKSTLFPENIDYLCEEIKNIFTI